LGAVEQVKDALERLEAEICAGAAHLERLVAGHPQVTRTEAADVLAALTLGKDLLRAERSAERRAEKRSAERTADDDCSPEPLRPAVANADAFALIVETMLAADHAASISRHERTLVVLHVDAESGDAHLHDGPALTVDTARRLACDASVCAVFRKGLEVLDLGRTQRLPNRAQRRALMARDGGCRFPGCIEKRYVEAHHVVHWTDGGPTDLANLVLLCWRHHHAVHEGGYTMKLSGGALTVWRPDGSVLESQALLLPDGPDIAQQNGELGLPITPHSVVSRWDGRRIDYADAVEGLLLLEDRFRRDAAAN
jgi:hypothetical protein